MIPPLLLLGGGLIYRAIDNNYEDQVEIHDVKGGDDSDLSSEQIRSSNEDIKSLINTIPTNPPIEILKEGSTSKKGLANNHSFVRSNDRLQAGYSKLKEGEYHEAILDFEEALRIDGDDPNSYLGLGLAYYSIKDLDRAKGALEQGLKIYSGSAIAHKLLGEIYYQRDDLVSALSHWEKALSLDPRDQELRRRFLKASREFETHKGFNSEITRHFTVQYEGGEKNEIGRKIIEILENAYHHIGRELSYYPGKEVTVILYSKQQFRYVTNGPSWSSGIYDGKIRVPIGGLKGDEPMLRQILFHEYTHSLIHSITDRCPTWLNEGLAQYFEGRDKDRARNIMKEFYKRNAVVPLEFLEGSFLRLNKNQADLVYLESLSAVSYMVERYGLYSVKELLIELSKGNSIDDSFRSALYIPYKEFEKDWKRSLEG